jgi:hypothetical protein
MVIFTILMTFILGFIIGTIFSIWCCYEAMVEGFLDDHVIKRYHAIDLNKK